MSTMHSAPGTTLFAFCACSLFILKTFSGLLVEGVFELIDAYPFGGSYGTVDVFEVHAHLSLDLYLTVDCVLAICFLIQSSPLLAWVSDDVATVAAAAAAAAAKTTFEACRFALTFFLVSFFFNGVRLRVVKIEFSKGAIVMN